MTDSSPSRSPEPLGAAIGRWARGTRPPALRLLALMGAGGAVLVIALDWRRWPVAAVLLGVAAFGAWGLMAHRERSHRPGVRLVQDLVAWGGGLLFVVGLLGLFFWTLGPAPIL